MAERTRSFASCTAVSGRPTMAKAGSPCEMSTSTSTISPSRPTMAQLLTFASTCPPNGAGGNRNRFFVCQAPLFSESHPGDEPQGTGDDMRGPLPLHPPGIRPGIYERRGEVITDSPDHLSLLRDLLRAGHGGYERPAEAA